MALNGNSAASARVPAAALLPQVHQQQAPPQRSASSILRRQQQQQPLLPRQLPATPSAASTPPSTSVSLAQPRPDGDRVANDYVEAPLRSCEPPPPRPPSRAGHAPQPRQPVRLPLPTAKRPPAAVVTKQPKKDECLAAAEGGAASSPADRPGICPECGECKCNACRGPKPLPVCWLCNNNVYCSPESLVDYASCLCCVKGIFYHCSKDYERDDGNQRCADEPCACANPSICARWGCLAALSVALPCLLCYWPLRALRAGYEACHNRLTSNRGCRCRPPPPPAPGDAEAASNKALLDGAAADKRLLDSSPE